MFLKLELNCSWHNMCTWILHTHTQYVYTHMKTASLCSFLYMQGSSLEHYTLQVRAKLEHILTKFLTKQAHYYLSVANENSQPFVVGRLTQFLRTFDTSQNVHSYFSFIYEIFHKLQFFFVCIVYIHNSEQEKYLSSF